MEFPVHPIQETGKRPTAALDRNLAYLGLVEILYGYPLDGVVLTTGCDKTTPACIMAAATVNLPAIVLSGGPMLNGWWHGERTGSGTVVWKARERLAAGEIDYDEFIEIVASSAPSVGHCNTMGTASTMNSIAEALGMSLPGCAAIPGALSRARPDRLRDRQARRRDGVGGPEAVRHPDPRGLRERHRRQLGDRRLDQRARSTSTPSPATSACKLDIEDWQTVGHKVPLLVNMQPAGKYLGEEYHRAGGVPAVVNELMKHGLIREKALTVNGKTMGDNCRGRESLDSDVILPVRQAAGQGRRLHRAHGQPVQFRDHEDQRDLRGVPRTATCPIPTSPGAFEGRAIVFDGPEDYHHRIDDPSLNIDENCMLFIRGTGPIGYPGGAEVVNMQPPAALIKRGIHSLPCIGDGRQSGTSGSPSILNASPEAAAGGGLAILRTGDRVRIDLNKGEANILISRRGACRSGAPTSPHMAASRSRRARRRGRRSSARWSTSSRRAWC